MKVKIGLEDGTYIECERAGSMSLRECGDPRCDRGHVILWRDADTPIAEFILSDDVVKMLLARYTKGVQ